MGNRFASLDEYHVLIQGHGILAAITFLFVLPASIMIVRFRDRNPGWGQRIHVYLNILAIFLVTIVFILGWFAVGPSRSLTNPHHGIGLTIYVLMLVQLIGGAWVRRRLRRTQSRRVTVNLMLHQWLGRAIALLGIVQVPLGLTLYGSPQFTFVLYTLWMTFLLVLYFILSYRAAPDRDSMRFSTVQEESVVQETKSGGIGRFILPAAAAAGIAGLIARRRSKRESRDPEVISSRRASRPGSYVEEVEKYSEDGRERHGLMDRLFTVAGVVGAGALAKSWWDRRQRRNRDEEAYSAVATDTPSRRRRRHDDQSVMSEESIDVRRDRRHGSILPGPGDPLAAAAAISAAQSRPVTPRPGPPPVVPPVGRPVGHGRHDSFSSYDSRASPRRGGRDGREDHAVRNTILGGIGLGWLAKRYKDRKDRQERERIEAIRAQEAEDERILETERRTGKFPPRFTGDGTPRRSHGRVTEVTDSDISSDLTASTIEPRRGGAMPPLAAGAIPAAAAAAAGAAGAGIAQSRSRHDITEPVPPPPREPREWQESGSDVYNSPGGREHRRHHSNRGREAEAAVAGAALGVAAAEEERRRRERSRGQQGVASPPVSVKVKVMPDRGVTLRRLTEEEAAADRAARRDQSRRRGDSVSSLSAADTAASNRRYRRDESARREAAEIAAEKQVEAGSSRRPLSPPRPAFAAGRQPKDSSYFSGPVPPPPESLESHGTWSGMSPSGTGPVGAEDPAERRRRRRLERNQRQAAGTVEYE
jgi:Eukaryotic cytochrome b561